jgi:hypothetical protein
MKRKALILAVLCVMGISFLSITTAGAAYYTCQVQQVGIDLNGYGVIYLTEGTAFPTSTIFIVLPNDPNKNTIIASALTAFANSTNLSADLSGTTAYSVVMGANAAK